MTHKKTKFKFKGFISDKDLWNHLLNKNVIIHTNSEGEYKGILQYVSIGLCFLHNATIIKRDSAIMSANPVGIDPSDATPNWDSWDLSIKIEAIRAIDLVKEEVSEK